MSRDFAGSIKEYRIVLPCSVEEYQVGQLFSVAEASKNETGGGDGIEVLKNEAYDNGIGGSGQYTLKMYHVQSKVPGFVRVIAPASALLFQEEAWNAYPYCKTVITNSYMEAGFSVKIETWHKTDLGDTENVHGLPPNVWKKVEVVPINIGDGSVVQRSDYKKEEDPSLFKSEKTGRGPLEPGWQKDLGSLTNCPHMCAYKLVTVYCKFPGLKTRIEKFIHKQEQRIFTNFHRQLFCWLDRWVDLNMDDIRRMENDTQACLDELRKQGEVRGTSAVNDQ
uniref:phosphatidylinositol transfer protein beta isoform-like n=1 Tax=Myxine glutinosa TaxID=7769 RepID=UPI0035902ED0